nr:immunoglobulin light chain junction region [Macaca mulatta]
LMQGQEFPYTF